MGGCGGFRKDIFVQFPGPKAFPAVQNLCPQLTGPDAAEPTSTASTASTASPWKGGELGAKVVNWVRSSHEGLAAAMSSPEVARATKRVEKMWEAGKKGFPVGKTLLDDIREKAEGVFWALASPGDKDGFNGVDFWLRCALLACIFFASPPP